MHAGANQILGEPGSAADANDHHAAETKMRQVVCIDDPSKCLLADGAAAGGGGRDTLHRPGGGHEHLI